MKTAMCGTFLKKKKNTAEKYWVPWRMLILLPDLKKKKKKILWNFTDLGEVKHYYQS